ncbi:hypothetical protein ACFE04_026192 [Oxalis oulophora]
MQNVGDFAKGVPKSPSISLAPRCYVKKSVKHLLKGCISLGSLCCIRRSHAPPAATSAAFFYTTPPILSLSEEVDFSVVADRREKQRGGDKDSVIHRLVNDICDFQNTRAPAEMRLSKDAISSAEVYQTVTPD